MKITDRVKTSAESPYAELSVNVCDCRKGLHCSNPCHCGWSDATGITDEIRERTGKLTDEDWGRMNPLMAALEFDPIEPLMSDAHRRYLVELEAWMERPV